VNSWVEISAERLKQNYTTLKRAAGTKTEVLAVIKANGYGHGATLCAPVLAQAGTGWLGVGDAAEGAEVLRSLGDAQPRPRVMVMCGPPPEDALQIVAEDLVPVVWTLDQLEALRSAAAEMQRQVPVHLEIDTGMSRQGVSPGPMLDEVLAWFATQEALKCEGVLTHFASADVAGSPQTAQQRKRFEAALRQVANAGLRPQYVHAGSTSTVDCPGSATDKKDMLAWLQSEAAALGAQAMVRAGLGLYGYCLPVVGANARTRLRESLLPVMTWKTRIAALQEIATGEQVGYNGVFTARKPMRLALLPVGYSNGLRRELLGSDTQPGGWVMIAGRRAPIVGRISMNLTMADVTEISGAKTGDEVVLLGDGITAQDHANIAETIPYEILCGVHVPSRRLLPIS
jgi:alanine racemase